MCVEHLRSRRENGRHGCGDRELACPALTQHGCTVTDQMAAQSDLGKQLGTTDEKVKDLQQGGCCSYTCLSNTRKGNLLQEVK